MAKTMVRQRRHHGVGAICEILIKYLHSRPVVAAKYTNAGASQHLGGLLCIRQEMKMVNHKQVMCYVFQHDEFENQELHCLQRWSKVTTEEGPEHVIPLDILEEVSNEQEGAAELVVPALQGLENDSNRLRGEGYGVDDDNESGPENTPTAAASGGDHAIYGEWGFSGIC
jgi:hypothetical protein